MIYVHRYLRLTPILAFIIIVSLSLIKRVIETSIRLIIIMWNGFIIWIFMMIFKVGSGPLWFSYLASAINCDKYWWTSLLYIQNYYNPESIVSILTATVAYKSFHLTISFASHFTNFKHISISMFFFSVCHTHGICQRTCNYSYSHRWSDIYSTALDTLCSRFSPYSLSFVSDGRTGSTCTST